jgi:hypothetical protein
MEQGLKIGQVFETQNVRLSIIGITDIGVLYATEYIHDEPYKDHRYESFAYVYVQLHRHNFKEVYKKSNNFKQIYDILNEETI